MQDLQREFTCSGIDSSPSRSIQYENCWYMLLIYVDILICWYWYWYIYWYWYVVDICWYIVDICWSIQIVDNTSYWFQSENILLLCQSLNIPGMIMYACLLSLSTNVDLCFHLSASCGSKCAKAWGKHDLTCCGWAANCKWSYGLIVILQVEHISVLKCGLIYLLPVYAPICLTWMVLWPPKLLT